MCALPELAERCVTAPVSVWAVCSAVSLCQLEVLMFVPLACSALITAPAASITYKLYQKGKNTSSGLKVKVKVFFILRSSSRHHCWPSVRSGDCDVIKFSRPVRDQYNCLLFPLVVLFPS